MDDGSVVVDSGFSYTHVVPYIQGEKYVNSIKRLNIGGKVSSVCFSGNTNYDFINF